MFYGAIVLAGGRSERMHFPKLFLNFDGRIFAEKIADEYAQAGVAVAVVINKQFLSAEWKPYLSRIERKALIVENDAPDRGRLYSMRMGFRALPRAKYYYLQNVDNPFVNASMIRKLAAQRNPSGYVAPVYKSKGGHPILISQQTMEDLCHTSSDEQDLRSFLHLQPRKELAVRDDSILVNMNSPDIYYKEMLKYGVQRYIR